MAKRLKHDIYRALGEYIINKDSRLLNEEQLKVAKEHEPILTKMYGKVLREKENVKSKICQTDTRIYFVFYLCIDVLDHNTF